MSLPQNILKWNVLVMYCSFSLLSLQLWTWLWYNTFSCKKNDKRYSLLTIWHSAPLEKEHLTLDMQMFFSHFISLLWKRMQKYSFFFFWCHSSDICFLLNEWWNVFFFSVVIQSTHQKNLIDFHRSYYRVLSAEH